MLFPVKLTLTYNNLIENKLSPRQLKSDCRKHILMMKLQSVPISKNKQVEELTYLT